MTYDPLNPTWPPESAVIVPVALPPALERLRRAYVPVALIGVPAHITLLYPLVPPAVITPTDVERLREVLRHEPPFELELSAVRSFPAEEERPGTTWLAPMPTERFVNLTQAIWAAFPAHPPFVGAYDEIVPHLTLADAAARLAEVEAVARPILPLRRRVTEAWLMVEGDDRRWRRRARLPMAVGGSARGYGRGDGGGGRPAPNRREVHGR